MNNNNTPADSLSELRQGMSALKNSLPKQGIVSDSEIRKSMESKSSFLNKIFIAELIVFPIAIIILLAAALATGMNVWCVLALLIIGIPDIILDARTLRVSKKWIYEESLVELSRKLVRQKKERQYQTIIGLLLGVPWGLWFIYEYTSRFFSEIPQAGFNIVWGATSIVFLVATLIIVALLYVKAQRINDQMIANINSFTDEE